MASPLTRFRGYQTALALAALLGVACGTGSAPPLAPQPGATTQPPRAVPTPPTGTWNLTTTLTSVSGPATCFTRQLTSADWLLDVRSSGTEITLLYDVNNWPTDHIELVGIREGDAFTASTSSPGQQPCLGQYVFESRVAGQFSADGTAITARETWTYRLGSGEAVALSFDWMATRR